MKRIIFSVVLGLVLTSSTSLADDARLRAPLFPFAKAMGATAAVYVADVMPGVGGREPSLRFVLASFGLRLGGR